MLDGFRLGWIPDGFGSPSEANPDPDDFSSRSDPDQGHGFRLGWILTRATASGWAGPERNITPYPLTSTSRRAPSGSPAGREFLCALSADFGGYSG